MNVESSRWRAAVMVALALGYGCGGSDPATTNPGGGGGGGNSDVASVTIDAVAAPLLVADSVRLTVTVKNSSGTVLTGRTTTFTSSSTDIASVTSGGSVVGAGPGTATITATVEGKSGTTPVTVALDPARSLAVAQEFSCALVATGAAYCWGTNSQGQLGAGENSAFKPPGLVSGGRTYIEISANTLGGCGITAQRAAFCWGSHYLGDNTANTNLAPVAVSGGFQWKSIAVGGKFVCGLTVAGAAYCWGDNPGGQLGVGTSSPTMLAPTPVLGNLTFVQITAGYKHICALTAAGAAYCWGSNLAGQLGTGGTGTVNTTPTAVVGGSSFRRISAGTETTCGVTTAGAAYCWGTSNYGSLGVGSTAQLVAPVPAAVSGGAGVAGVIAGNSVDIRSPVCMWTTAGAGSCWGANLSNQLGTTASTTTCLFATPCAPTPVPVASVTDFTVVSAASDHGCGMTKRHTVYCWGANSTGALGDGTLSNRATAVQVQNLPATP